MSNLFEIHGDGINVDEIMEKINENIRKRIEEGAYPESTISELGKSINEKSVETYKKSASDCVDFILNNWNINNDAYSITSHHPITGKVLISGRKLVHGEVRRYVDPANFMQSEFNGCVARLCNYIYQKSETDELRIEKLDEVISNIKYHISLEVDEKLKQLYIKSNQIDEKLKIINEKSKQIYRQFTYFSNEFDEKLKQLNTKSNQIDEKMKILSEKSKQVYKPFIDFSNELNSKIKLQDDKFADFSNELNSKILDEIESKLISVSSKVNKNYGNKICEDLMDYFVFTKEISEAWTRIGGSYTEAPNVYEDSKIFFKDCKNVLDIGCGPGTLLMSLKEANIGSYGVDLNEKFIDFAQKLGLNVLKTDAISHLNVLDSRSIDGVFISQLIEHLSNEEILKILKLCYDKMQDGSYIIITTPNIQSVIVSTNLFYLDPTHRSHVHPEVLKFMLESCGYRDLEERYYQPVANEIRLKKIDSFEATECGDIKDISKMINLNIENLNNLLFGFRDYCVIAKK
jgi:2-polyprenyl-3-methyl-5-hydroxy-6-metoxy-1,4-benzoquinol methylase